MQLLYLYSCGSGVGRQLGEAIVEGVGQRVAVKILANEDEFDHAVAIDGIPVVTESGLTLYHRQELLAGSRGIPQAGLGELLLNAGLFKQERHLGLVGEV